MASGLPKSYIKRYGITKRAWREYRKSKSTKTRKVRTIPRRRRRSYRRRIRRRIRRPKTIPILPVAGAVSGLVSGSSWSGGASVVQRLMEGNLQDAATIFKAHYLGIDSHTGQFNIELAKTGWVPMILGAIGHKAANMLGINRQMAHLPSPLNKLRL